MASPWLRRVENEFKGLKALRERSSRIAFVAEGSPPTTYRVNLSCRSLARNDADVVIVDRHSFDLHLDRRFPVVSPHVVWKTPIFHPNFNRPAICLGTHWYPGWTISDMCIAVYRMVGYQDFNIYDPLDKEAAAWLIGQLEECPEKFPVETTPFLDLDFDIQTIVRKPEGSK